MQKKVILASGSPRRKQLLETAGVELVVEVPCVDESHDTKIIPQTYVQKTAYAKADAVFCVHQGEDAVIVAADTIVVRDGVILGKPKDEADARHTLVQLSGRCHHVMTAVCVIEGKSGKSVQFVSETEVYFTHLSERMIERYVATGEPMDKAGSYGIQAGAAGFVEKIVGSYTNVVGLPVCETMAVLRDFGVDV